MLAAMTFIINFTTNNHFFYSLPLLVMYPKYKCSDPLINCDHEAYCLNKESVSVDWSNDWSLQNWVPRFSLECVEPYRIGMLGSLFYLGSTIMGIFVTRLGDIYGRKLPTMISSILAIPI